MAINKVFTTPKHLNRRRFSLFSRFLKFVNFHFLGIKKFARTNPRQLESNKTSAVKNRVAGFWKFNKNVGVWKLKDSGANLPFFGQISEQKK